MAIPFRSEERAHKDFLKYQIQLEGALADLHKNTEIVLSNIINRNVNSSGTIDKAKIKLIVDKYMRNALKDYRIQLARQLKVGVADSATLGMKSIMGAVAPHRKVTSDLLTNITKAIRNDIVNLRGVDGLTLSERVWKLTRDNEFELKRILAGDILQGASAGRISRDLRGFLNQPDTVRGKLRDLLRPGTGTYKSAYKNALRVARTETNRAYIDGQADTAKAMGYKLQFKLSGAHPEYDICDPYDGQIFDPDDFPAPVHPNCMCYGLTVLPS